MKYRKEMFTPNLSFVLLVLFKRTRHLFSSTFPFLNRVQCRGSFCAKCKQLMSIFRSQFNITLQQRENSLVRCRAVISDHGRGVLFLYRERTKTFHSTYTLPHHMAVYTFSSSLKSPTQRFTTLVFFLNRVKLNGQRGVSASPVSNAALVCQSISKLQYLTV